MSDLDDPWKFATVESFELVSVAGSTVLLRLAAVSARTPVVVTARPTLVADDGQVVNSFAAIPAPPDTGEVLRAAYAVSRSIVSEATVFSLEFPDFSVIALPHPTEGSNRSAPRAVTAVEASEGNRRSDLQPKLSELAEVLAETRQETSELRGVADTARAEAEAARAAMLRGHLQAAIQSAELEAVRDIAALTQSSAFALAAPGLTDGTSPELANLTERLRVTERERDEAQRALAVAEMDHASTRAQLSELEVWSAELERRLSETTSQLAARVTSASRMSSDELERAAVADAHAQAERELAEAASAVD